MGKFAFLLDSDENRKGLPFKYVLVKSAEGAFTPALIGDCLGKRNEAFVYI